MMLDVASNGIPKSDRTDLVWGTVITPLPDIKIKIDGDAGFELTKTFLKLGVMCTERYLTIPAQTLPQVTWTHQHDYSGDISTEVETEVEVDTPMGPGTGTGTGTGTGNYSGVTEPVTYTHTHEIPDTKILLWRGLQPDDRVIMLRFKDGNQYYVLQREMEDAEVFPGEV
jgi:hypothetical protein